MYSVDYENFVFEFINYYISTNKVGSYKDHQDGWEKIITKNPTIFDNTDFFFKSLNILKNHTVESRYNFLRAYNYLYNMNALLKDNPIPNSRDLLIRSLSSLEIILGRDLIAKNGRRVELESSFEIKSYINLPKLSLVAFEFAPIIDDWIEMCFEIKVEFQELFDEKLSFNIGEKVPMFNHAAYKNFMKKRDVIIDNLVLIGRLDEKNVNW